MSYSNFIARKLTTLAPVGLNVSIPTLGLKGHQQVLAQWALKRGRAAIFADTGLGKTRMQLAWANAVYQSTAREHDDERHICPLQLDVIRRGVELWTNPGDVVLSPFMGIGSEGYVALEMGRKFVGVELKESYFKQAAANLAAANKQVDMFAA